MVTRNNTTNINKLNNISTVKRLVPSDTTFAVIADLTEQNFSGVTYLCVSKTQLRIVGAKGELAAANLADVTVKREHGTYAIHLSGRVFTITSLTPVAGAHSFASRVAGIDGGASPLLNALSSGGASVQGISGARYYIAIVVFAAVLIIIVGSAFYLGIR